MRTRKIIVEHQEALANWIDNETDPTIKYRLAFLQAVIAHHPNWDKPCQIFSVSMATAYNWIREWNQAGYTGIAHPYQMSEKPRGRPPTLNDQDLVKLKSLLMQKPYWLIHEVVELIFNEWGVKLSRSQVARILRHQLKMNFSKPYPQDYRRPSDASEKLKQKLTDAYNLLKEKGIDRMDVALGFIDEASPQTTANTVRFWHFGHDCIIKNTSRYKANAIGFYAINGNSVIDFMPDSKQETLATFLLKIKDANENFKAIIVVLDNFSSHWSRHFRSEAERLGITLVFLSPYSPDLNPTEQIWKSIKREVSAHFIQSQNHLKMTIAESWGYYSQFLSFSKAWVDQFTPWIPIEI